MYPAKLSGGSLTDYTYVHTQLSYPKDLFPFIHTLLSYLEDPY